MLKLAIFQPLQYRYKVGLAQTEKAIKDISDIFLFSWIDITIQWSTSKTLFEWLLHAFI